MVDIAVLETELSGLGVKLETARTRRQKHLRQLRHVMNQAEATGDRKVIAAQDPLNKLIETDQRLVAQIEKQIGDTKRMLDLARGQAAVIASRAAAAQSSTAEKNRWFSVRTPAGKTVRHKHSSAAALRASLLPGYELKFEVFGCDDAGDGGIEVLTGQPDVWMKALREMSEAQ